VKQGGFFLQQSLEKYLKAFLVKRNWNLRKIHELDALLDEASKYQQELATMKGETQRMLRLITVYTPTVPKWNDPRTRGGRS